MLGACDQFKGTIGLIKFDQVMTEVLVMMGDL